MQKQNEKTKKLFEFNHALYLVNEIVKNKSRIRKINMVTGNEELEKLIAKTEELQEQVNNILKNIFKGREELISIVEISYDDRHVAEIFQDYMQLI